MKHIITSIIFLMLLPYSSMASSPDNTRVQYNTIKIDKVSIFYREAGPKGAPVILLLHGFPSSSHMFRNLIPQLAKSYRVIAPDYPGFGQSSSPDTTKYKYDFATLANTIERFTNKLKLKKYTLYMQDFGGPVGFRLALKQPKRIERIIIQNATLHAKGWNPDIVSKFAPYWKKRTQKTEKPIRNFLKAETTKWQYTQGSKYIERLSPDAWINDQSGLDRPGNDKIQLEYLWNYQNNVANYKSWQNYLAKKQPKTLIVWGKNDPLFTIDGVNAIKSLVPKAEVHLYEAGHFALETHALEISKEILSFMTK